MHPLKIAFSSRSVLGVQSGCGFVGAVRVQRGLHGPKVSHAAFREVGEAEEPAAVLARLLREEDLGAESVATSLPSVAAELREVPASLRNPGKLARIIKYQVEELISVPIEETVVDFIPAGTNGHVLAAAVRKSAVAEHLEALSSAGLDPDRVILDDLALFSLYRRITGGDESREAVALVRIEPDRGGVQVLRNGRLSLLRTLPTGQEGEEALVEALRLDGLRHPGRSVERVLLTGRGVLGPGTVETLGARLDLPVEIWQPFRSYDGGASPIDRASQARLSVALGLAVAAGDPLTERFNLRRETYTKRSGAPDRRLVAGLLAGLFLLGTLFAVHLHQRNSALEVRHEQIRTRMHQTLLETFPETPMVIRGQEAEQMAQKVREQRSRFGWLEEITSEKTVLELLTAVTTTLSGHRDVTIDNISADEGTVHLDGRASSFQTVDAIKEKLEQEPRFREAKLLSAKSEKGQGAVRFSFVLVEAE